MSPIEKIEFFIRKSLYSSELFSVESLLILSPFPQKVNCSKSSKIKKGHIEPRSLLDRKSHSGYVSCYHHSIGYVRHRFDKLLRLGAHARRSNCDLLPHVL